MHDLIYRRVYFEWFRVDLGRIPDTSNDGHFLAFYDVGVQAPPFDHLLDPGNIFFCCAWFQYNNHR